MINEQHELMVERLAKSGAAILAAMTPATANLLHHAVGVSGEAGELLGAIKKVAVYNKPIDRENIIEELGDIEFYLAGIRSALGISRDETLAHNMAKLAKRYPRGYSNEAAQLRADKQ